MSIRRKPSRADTLPTWRAPVAVATIGLVALAGCAKQETPTQSETTPSVLGGEVVGPVSEDMLTATTTPPAESLVATKDKLRSMTNEEVLNLFTIDRDMLYSSNPNVVHDWFEERGSGQNIINGPWFLDENTIEKTEQIDLEGYSGNYTNLELPNPDDPAGPRIRPFQQMNQNFTNLANTIQANRPYFESRTTEAEDILLAGTEHIFRDINLLNRDCGRSCPDIFDNEITQNLIDFVLKQDANTVIDEAFVCGSYNTSVPEIGTGTDLCFWLRDSNDESTSDGFKLTHDLAQLFSPNSTQPTQSYDRYADGDWAVVQFNLRPVSQTNPSGN